MSNQISVPAGDTRLHTIDTPGGEPPLLFVNGGFATLQHWRPVIAALGGRYRTVQFDARGRGKSGVSTDYSLPSAVDDIGRVIEATGLVRPILVGWSHGATTAVRYAAQHPDKVRGLVLVDGAYPISMFDEAGKAKVRDQFRKLRWLMRIAAALGHSARLTADESAEVVIEMDAANGELVADFAALTVPTVFVRGTGSHSGATEEEMRTLRAVAAKAVEVNGRVSVFATVPANHIKMVSASAGVIAQAIDQVVAQAR